MTNNNCYLDNYCLSTKNACIYCQQTSSTCIELSSLCMAVALSRTFSEPLIPFAASTQEEHHVNAIEEDYHPTNRGY